ncbi:IS5 family transposase [Undibacterium sp. KW1]|uniref:IS5 family transposase n=1 Tax=Undibacterium sp. KW1 TaxID=2058624 RepID=UPI00351B0FD9
MSRMLLRDDQWARIERLLPGRTGGGGRAGGNDRLFIDAVLWIARTGSPWRDLPVEFGYWNTVYTRFARWSERDCWQSIFSVLREEADFEEVYLDSTVVRAHQHAAGAAKKKGEQALGRSRGGLTTKIDVCVEGLAEEARFLLTGGHCHDVTQAEALLKDLQPGAVLADKAYDANALIARIQERNAKVVIPSKSNRKEPREIDAFQYRNRNVIERFFARIKQFRRIATRYDKLASRFASFFAIVASFEWLK